jgi:exonuclease VII large subunit
VLVEARTGSPPPLVPSHAPVTLARGARRSGYCDERRGELGRLGAQMAALSPLAVLDRGYAMVRAGDVIVRDAAQVKPRDRLHVKLSRGSIDVVVKSVASPEGDKIQDEDV